MAEAREEEAEATDEGAPAAADSFYCHSCLAAVNNVPAEFTCPECGQGFLERIERDHMEEERNREEPEQGGNEAGQLFQGILGNLLGIGQQGGAGQNMFEAFLQQLAGNLEAGAAGQHQMRFQIHNGPEGGVVFNLGNLPGMFGGALHGNPGDYAWGANGLDAVVTQVRAAASCSKAERGAVQLLNQFEGGAPPLTAQQIKDIPTVAVSEAQAEMHVQCTTCMEELTVGEMVRRLPCQHCFHTDCIVPWLERHNTCPICRKSLSDASEQTASGQPPPPPPPPPDRPITDTIDDLD